MPLLIAWLLAALICSMAAAIVFDRLPSLIRRLFFVVKRRRYARRANARAKGSCPDCGYDLTGNVSGTCPECGRKVR